jgi:AhpD family alkylhydroperoxidase
MSEGPRLDYANIAPGALAALMQVERYVRQSGLEASLIELVKIRASQLNGCAYCIDMHTKDARGQGETEQRIFALSAWREAPFFSERERAALAWTEAVTLLHQEHVADELYQRVRAQFGEREIVDLTMAVVAINAWNRVAIAFRPVVGSYRPQTVSAGPLRA